MQLCNSWYFSRASSCLTPDGRRIAASNLVYGLDIYDIQSGSLSATIPQNVVKEYPPPIVYIHEGHAIASGDGGCNVHIYNAKGRKRVQTLSVQGAFLGTVDLDDTLR